MNFSQLKTHSHTQTRIYTQAAAPAANRLGSPQSTVERAVSVIVTAVCLDDNAGTPAGMAVVQRHLTAVAYTFCSRTHSFRDVPLVTG